MLGKKLFSLLTAVLLTTGCASPLRRGLYDIPKHKLIVVDDPRILEGEYRLRGGNLGRKFLFGFISGDEIFCLKSALESCYLHELKHLLGLWDGKHVERPLHSAPSPSD